MSGQCVAKTIIIFLNIITGLIGLVLLAVGIMLQFFKTVLATYLDVVIEDFLQQSPEGFEYESGLDITEYLQDAAIPLIVIGAFIFILALFGCIGACCGVRCCMMLYAIFVTIIFVALLAGVIVMVVMKQQIIDKTGEALTTWIKDEYKGDNHTSVVALGLVLTQRGLNCCGIYNYTDFHEAKLWNRSYAVPGTPPTTKLQIPASCCMPDGDIFSIDLVDPTCPVAPKSTNSFMDSPCLLKLVDYAMLYITYVYIAEGVILGLLLIVCIAAWYLWKKLGEDDLGSAAKMV